MVSHPAFPRPYLPPYGNPYGRPAITYVPVLRPVNPPGAPPGGDILQARAPQAQFAPPAAQSSVPASEAPAVPGVPADAGISDEIPQTKPEAPAEAAPDASEKPALPKSFAQETGDKVGQLVTQVIEGNPQLEARLQEMKLDNILADPNSFANRIKEGLQGSRLFRTLMRFDKHLISSLPAEYEPTAREFLQWLKSSSPSPEAGL